jgi:DNA-binding NarL/FixJ family response regulator
VFAFLYFQRLIRKRTSFEGILKDVREEVNRLLQRIDEITDKDISLIEERERGLKSLLEETDKRLAAMNRELARRENAEEAYRKLGRFQAIEKAKPLPETAPPPKSSSEDNRSQEDQIRELARSGFSPQIIASRLGISVSEAEFAVALHERRDS